MTSKQHFKSGRMSTGKPPKARLKKRPRPNGGAGGPAIESLPKGATIYDFWAFRPKHDYIFMPSGQHWPTASINSIFAALPLLGKDGKPLFDEKGKPRTQKASNWLDVNRHVEGLTWAPGKPPILADTLATEDGLIPSAGNNTFNTYKPSNLKPGDPERAKLWLDHCYLVYGDQADHMIKWFAHRAQFPWQKVNHALVMGGPQGVGKDTILEPVKRAIASGNFKEISPKHLKGDFTEFVRAVILRINEAHDLGDIDRYGFYEMTKQYTASPPDVLLCNVKHIAAYYVVNVMGVILTTNHRTTGIYLPSDDRRHYVMWSEKVKGDFEQAYWDKLWAYYDSGGDAHVMAHLLQLDLSNFNPKAPPEKTQAWYDIVDANSTPEDSELADALDKLGTDDPNNEDQKIWPDVVTVEMIKDQTKSRITDRFKYWLEDRRNGRTISHRFDSCDYEIIRATSNKGRWIIGGARQAVYAKKSLSPHEQYTKAEQLSDSYKRNNPASNAEGTASKQGELYDEII